VTGRFRQVYLSDDLSVVAVYQGELVGVAESRRDQAGLGVCDEALRFAAEIHERTGGLFFEGRRFGRLRWRGEFFGWRVLLAAIAGSRPFRGVALRGVLIQAAAHECEQDRCEGDQGASV
jgi:hypothetical protein